MSFCFQFELLTLLHVNKSDCDGEIRFDESNARNDWVPVVAIVYQVHMRDVQFKILVPKAKVH